MSLTDSIDRLEAELGSRFDRLVRGLNDEIRRRIDQGQQEILRQLEQVAAERTTPLLSREDLDPLTAQARTEGAAGGLAEGRTAAWSEILDAYRAFDAASHQADLLDALLDHCAGHASRTALFLTRTAGARYWAGRGWGESAAQMNGLELAWDETAGWDRLVAGGGPVELRSAECAPLCSRIESSLPGRAVLIPLVLRDRVAAAVYADRAEGDGDLDLPALQALIYGAALAIESLPFRERAATPTLAAAGASAVALPLWDATGPVAVSEPEPPPQPPSLPDTEADTEAPIEAPLEVDAEPEPDSETPVELPTWNVSEPEPEPEPGLLPMDNVLEPSGEPDVAPAMEPTVPEEPAPDVPWSFEPSRESWEVPAAAEPAGPSAEQVAEDVWAGTSAIEDSPWPSREPEPAAPAVDEPPAESPWAAAAEPASAWSFPVEPAPLEPAPFETPAFEPAAFEPAAYEPAAFEPAAFEPAAFEPASFESRAEEAPAYQPAAWAPEDEIAPPPEYTAAPELEPEPEDDASAAPPPAETVLLDRSAFASAFQAPPPPPAHLPDEREETRPGFAGSAMVVPPSDVQGPGWAFSTGRVPASAAAAQTAADDAAHDEARRLARLLVSEIRLYNEDQVEEGRRQRNLYDRLRDDIERSRQLYAERVDPRVVASADYFDQELVRILAGGDAEALGR